MSERVFLLMTVATAAVGCSMLVNTDFTGGTEPIASNKGGQAGATVVEMGGTFIGSGGSFGGSVGNEGGAGDVPAEGGFGNEPDLTGGSGGTGAFGGSDVSGGTGGDGSGGTDGGAGEPSENTGGDGTTGGTSGGLAGSAGTDASGGGGMGGLGGVAGAARGGRGGRGQGGIGGMGVAGNANCPGANLMTDPAHCGSCDKVCDEGVDCDNGICVTTPCAGICATATTIPLSDGYREDAIPSTDACFETTQYSVAGPALPSLICWNFTDRVLQVNGVITQCVKEPGAALPPLRAGGYCVHATVSNSGDKSDGFKFPIPAQLMSSQ